MTCHISCSIPSLWMWLKCNFFAQQFLMIKEKYFPMCMSLANTERFSSNWYFSKQRQARGFGSEANSHVFSLDKSHCHLWDYRNVGRVLAGTYGTDKQGPITQLLLSPHTVPFSLLLFFFFLSSIGALVTGLHRSWFHTVVGQRQTLCTGWC